MDSFSNEALHLIYQRKYLSLKRRCEEVQQANEKLVNRIYNVKKIIRRYNKERSVLMQRLDVLGDDYQNALTPAFWEEGAGEDDTEEEEQETSQAVAAILGDVKQEPGVQSVDPSLPSSSSGQGAVAAEPVKKAKKEKRPANAYIIYCTVQRKAAQEKYLQLHGEEASRAELTKMLAQEWRQLSLEEKRVYHDLAEKKKQMAASTTSASNVVKSHPVENKMAAMPSNDVVYTTTQEVPHMVAMESDSVDVVMDTFVQSDIKEEQEQGKEFL